MRCPTTAAISSASTFQPRNACAHPARYRGREFAAGRAQALSDPTRLMVATALSGADELCVCDLSWIVERAQNLVSHHVRTLRTHGLIRSRREGKMVMYALTDEGRELLAAVLQPALGPEQARV